MDARILIIDGMPPDPQDRVVRNGGVRFAENYRSALLSQLPAHLGTLDCFVVPGGAGETLPHGVALSDFHGIAWTGSPLSAYDDTPEVTAQIAFAAAAFRTGIPCFRSCWGLQVMCAALGSRVHKNPLGLEFGVARQITLTEAGQAHPMYVGKGPMFDALCVHQDEVCRLPVGTRLLARNHVSAVQPIDIVDGDGRSGACNIIRNSICCRSLLLSAVWRGLLLLAGSFGQRKMQIVSRLICWPCTARPGERISRGAMGSVLTSWILGGIAGSLPTGCE